MRRQQLERIVTAMEAGGGLAIGTEDWPGGGPGWVRGLVDEIEAEVAVVAGSRARLREFLSWLTGAVVMPDLERQERGGDVGLLGFAYTPHQIAVEDGEPVIVATLPGAPGPSGLVGVGAGAIDAWLEQFAKLVLWRLWAAQERLARESGEDRVSARMPAPPPGGKERWN